MRMLDGLRYALDQTGFKWAFAGWSERPKTDYGVYELTGQVQFRSDEDSGSEIMLRGKVDYFTHDFTRGPQKAIENALRSLHLVWSLDDVQFEPETGFIHWTWSWSDPEGKTEMCRILFVEHGRTIEQFVMRGDTPEEPPRDGYVDSSGLRYVRTNWDAAIAVATGDATYTAEYHIFGYLIGEKVYNGKASDANGVPTNTRKFTSQEVEHFRTKTRTDGGNAYAIDKNEMSTYQHIYHLTIKQTGYEGYIISAPEIGDVTFQVQ